MICTLVTMAAVEALKHSGQPYMYDKEKQQLPPLKQKYIISQHEIKYLPELQHTLYKTQKKTRLTWNQIQEFSGNYFSYTEIAFLWFTLRITPENKGLGLFSSHVIQVTWAQSCMTKQFCKSTYLSRFVTLAQNISLWLSLFTVFNETFSWPFS